MHNIIDTKLIKNLDDWLEKKFNNLALPFYSSIDLRKSHHKIAPVDANFFPAGFNNLNNESREVAAALIKNYFSGYTYKKVLIIPEGYTRNKMYIQNVYAIESMLSLAGFDVQIGLLHDENIIKKGSTIQTLSGFIPDIIILNRDMTSHIPDILKNIEQDIIPNLLCGWHNRKKSKYFEIYKKVVTEFCMEFHIDPWLVSAFTISCSEIDFNDDASLEKVAANVDNLLLSLQEKHKEYRIEKEPYIFIKANNGTYGMGIIVVKNGEELLNLNKRKRNKMKKVKEGTNINSVIIQEGVSTVDTFKNGIAEPLVYYIGKTPACYLYRYNRNKDAYSNLNSIHCEFHDVSRITKNETLALWGVISKLAVLGLALEISSIVYDDSNK